MQTVFGWNSKKKIVDGVRRRVKDRKSEKLVAGYCWLVCGLQGVMGLGSAYPGQVVERSQNQNGFKCGGC